MIVVDASLAAKWMLWEDDSAAALAFIRNHADQLCGPDLLFAEVASAIVRRGNIDKPLRADAIRALDKWTISWEKHIIKPHRLTQARVFKAGRLALDMGHQIYDCFYLALAIELKCDLATCDLKFAEKARQIWPEVKLLADYAA
jgi:predicted nucleic acid-binding protein